jgi:hypothetical protein
MKGCPLDEAANRRMNCDHRAAREIVPRIQARVTSRVRGSVAVERAESDAEGFAVARCPRDHQFPTPIRWVRRPLSVSGEKRSARGAFVRMQLHRILVKPKVRVLARQIPHHWRTLV